jgi:hypothetical protein
MAEIGYILLLINILIYISGIKKATKKAYLVFTTYLIFIGVIEVLGVLFLKAKGGNLFLTHYYFIIQYLFLSYFYYLIIENCSVKKLIKTLTPLTLVSLSIQYFFYPDLFVIFNQYEIFICITPIVVYATCHLFQVFKTQNKKYIYITCGALLYFLPHALIFSSGNLMPQLPKKVNTIIWEINTIIYAVFLILIFVEWYTHFRKKAVFNKQQPVKLVQTRAF